MKKRRNGLIDGITTILMVFTIGATLLSSYKYFMVTPDSSSPEPISEEPVEDVYDISVHQSHIMYAIDDTAVLSVTVSPADAYDKTIVWSTSDNTKISVLKLTDATTETPVSTARITCETNFYGEVIITATATQGTTYTGDDVSATCTVTYDHPLEAIDLQLWNYGATPTHTGDASLVSNYTDITDFTNYYGFEVVLTPSTPTIYSYSFQNASDIDIETHTTINDSQAYQSGQAFKFDVNTLPDQTIGFEVISEDNIHGDAIYITIGEHLGVAGRQVTGDVEVWSNDRATLLDSYASYAALSVAVAQGKTWLAGVYIYISIDGMSYVDPTCRVTYSSTYFGYVAAGSSNMTNVTSGIADVTDPTSDATLVLYALASTGGVNSNITIDPINYASALLNPILSFELTEPVASLSMDDTEVSF